MQKRGQFFLIAALVITGIVLSLAAVYNYTIVKQEDKQFYDLSSEIGLESGSILNYGVYNSQDLGLLIENFTNIYSQSFGEGNQTLIFLYGDKTIVKYVIYQTSPTGSIGIGTGGSTSLIPVEGKEIKSGTANIQGNQVTVELDGKTYEFELKEGQNFLFVIQKEESDETLVATK